MDLLMSTVTFRQGTQPGRANPKGGSQRNQSLITLDLLLPSLLMGWLCIACTLSEESQGGTQTRNPHASGKLALPRKLAHVDYDCMK